MEYVKEDSMDPRIKRKEKRKARKASLPKGPAQPKSKCPRRKPKNLRGCFGKKKE